MKNYMICLKIVSDFLIQNVCIAWNIYFKSCKMILHWNNFGCCYIIFSFLRNIVLSFQQINKCSSPPLSNQFEGSFSFDRLIMLCLSFSLLKDKFSNFIVLILIILVKLRWFLKRINPQMLGMLHSVHHAMIWCN